MVGLKNAATGIMIYKEYVDLITGELKHKAVL